MIAEPSPAFIAHVVLAAFGVATLFVGAAQAAQRRRTHAPLQALGATFVVCAALVALGSDTFDRTVDASWRTSFDAVDAPSPPPSSVAETSTTTIVDSTPTTTAELTSTSTAELSSTMTTTTTSTQMTTSTSTSTTPMSTTTNAMPASTTTTLTTTMITAPMTTIDASTEPTSDYSSGAHDNNSDYSSNRKRHNAAHDGHSSVHANGGIALVLALSGQLALGTFASHTTAATDERGRVRGAHRALGYSLLVGVVVQAATGVVAATGACARDECAPRFAATALALTAAVGYRQVARHRQKQGSTRGMRALALVESAVVLGASVGYVLERMATERTLDRTRSSMAVVVAIAGAAALLAAVKRMHMLARPLDRGYLPSLAVFCVSIAALTTLRQATGDLERLATIEIGLALLAAAIARVALRFDATVVAWTLAAVAAASAQFTAVRRFDGALAPSIASVVVIQILVVVVIFVAWTLGERAFSAPPPHRRAHNAFASSSSSIDDDNNDDVDVDDEYPPTRTRRADMDDRIAALIAE